jgi:glucuronate isomerase
MGIGVFGDKVIVSSYEHVFVFTDANGDDVPEKKEVLFTLGKQNHDHTVHAFVFGPDGMRRFRELTTETAGFYNTVGFNDDTRAFCSIPARHDMARRIDCDFLAQRVADHRLDEDEAQEVAQDLAYRLAKKAYKL